MRDVRDKKKDNGEQFRMTAEEQLIRRNRIEQNDPMRFLSGNSIKNAENLEKIEIKTNAEVFERRNRSHGMDKATNRWIQLEKIRQRKEHRNDHLYKPIKSKKECSDS